MLSSLSRAAAAVRVVFVLYILSLVLGVVAVAADDGSHQQQSSPPQLPRAVIQRSEHHGTRETPPIVVVELSPADLAVARTKPLPFVIPAPIAISQEVTISVTWPYESLTLALCQTSELWDTSLLTGENTWVVMSIDFPFLNVNGSQNSGTSVPVPMTFEIPPKPVEGNTYQNFFFCWGTDNKVENTFSCQKSSTSFDVIPAAPGAFARNRRSIQSVPREAHIQPRFAGTPTQTIEITQSTLVLSILNSPTADPQPGKMLTVTRPETTETVFPTSTPTASVIAATSTDKSSSSKLGTGPIVGIAIGGVVVLILLIFAAFVCIRQRRNDNEVQHTLLYNGSTGSHDGSRGLQMEKSPSVTPTAPMLPFLETRPSSGPFDHLELSEPYSGPAGPVMRARPSSSLPPMASIAPTSAAVASTPVTGIAAAVAAAAAASAAPGMALSTESPVVPDNMSESSAPLSPRSTLRSVSAYSVPYSVPYSDHPTYGDARHTPQLYESPSQTPFLSEPGMTAEELSRLEEEERRIDAAIAEAEAARR